MAFRRVHTKYDRRTNRAYVELRRSDTDGGEIIVTAIFSYRNNERQTDGQIEREVSRKALHAFRAAADKLAE